MPKTVTISSSFGAGGNIVGTAVAARLGIPFFDRAIPVAVAGRLAISIEEAAAQDEKAPSSWERVARAFANMAVPMAPQNLVAEGTPDEFRAETERILHEIASTTGGVLLGRGSMIVLGMRPDVLRVRLDGPVEERIARVAAHDGITLDEARAMQEDTDRARDHYLKLFYKARQDDPSLYDIVIDTTQIPIESCTDLIASAAEAKATRNG